jgi:hypothetical protein
LPSAWGTHTDSGQVSFGASGFRPLEMRQVALVRLAIASAAVKVAMVEMDMMAVGLASFVGD